MDNAAGDWHAVASFVDGKPFLLRSFIGKGQAYVCTTLPEAGWSSLGKSWLLIPMVQRIVAAGGGRLSGQESALCGEWTPTGDEPWMTVDSETRKDCRWQAGVYRSGERLVALNRPSREDMPGALSIDEACDLFGELPVQVAAKLERAGTSQLQPSDSDGVVALLSVVGCLLSLAGCLPSLAGCLLSLAGCLLSGTGGLRSGTGGLASGLGGVPATHTLTVLQVPSLHGAPPGQVPLATSMYLVP